MAGEVRPFGCCCCCGAEAGTIAVPLLALLLLLLLLLLSPLLPLLLCTNVLNVAETFGYPRGVESDGRISARGGLSLTFRPSRRGAADCRGTRRRPLRSSGCWCVSPLSVSGCPALPRQRSGPPCNVRADVNTDAPVKKNKKNSVLGFLSIVLVQIRAAGGKATKRFVKRLHLCARVPCARTCADAGGTRGPSEEEVKKVPGIAQTGVYVFTRPFVRSGGT